MKVDHDPWSIQSLMSTQLPFTTDPWITQQKIEILLNSFKSNSQRHYDDTGSNIKHDQWMVPGNHGKHTNKSFRWTIERNTLHESNCISNIGTEHFVHKFVNNVNQANLLHVRTMKRATDVLINIYSETHSNLFEKKLNFNLPLTFL